MPSTTYSAMPAEGRLWAFGSSRPLTDEEERRVLDRVDTFLDQWKAHGTPLTAARDWRYGRVLLVAVDERTAPPSGCSIDAMVRVLKELGEELGATFLDNGPVWFLTEGEVRRVSRPEFRTLAKAGQVGPDTEVLDFTVTRVADDRDGRFRAAAGETWMRRTFFRQPVS